MHTREEKIEAFGRLVDVLDRLRTECPWDKKQTNKSLRPNTIEETFELADALLKNDKENICEVFRHPHIYGDSTAETSDDVLKNWEQIKLKENGGKKRVLSGVPDSLPSLIKAYRVQDKARNVGFDWADRKDVWKKVHEELNELEAELEREDKDRSTRELGDFLFSVINAARLYKLNPDNALEYTNQKFIRRFNYIEEHSIRAGKPLTEMSLEEMDKLWEEAKSKE